jgi:hypothetical protein
MPTFAAGRYAWTAGMSGNTVFFGVMGLISLFVQRVASLPARVDFENVSVRTPF